MIDDMREPWRETPPTFGEMLGGAFVALCFVLLIPFLGLFFQ